MCHTIYAIQRRELSSAIVYHVGTISKTSSLRIDRLQNSTINPVRNKYYESVYVLFTFLFVAKNCDYIDHDNNRMQ